MASHCEACSVPGERVSHLLPEMCPKRRQRRETQELPVRSVLHATPQLEAGQLEGDDAIETIRLRWSGPVVSVAARTRAEEDVHVLLAELDRERLAHRADTATLKGIEAVCGPLGYWPPHGGDPVEDLATWLQRRLAPRPGVCSSCGCTDLAACKVNGRPCSWANQEETLCSGCVP